MIWEASAVKFVLFTAPPFAFGVNASELWNKAVGTPPQTYNEIPSPIPTSIASGRSPSGSGQATLTLQPGRIDLAFMPAHRPGEDTSRPPTVLLEAALADGAAIAGMIYPGVPIQRIGLNTEFFSLPGSGAAAVDELIAELPIEALPQGAEDLIFQVNVPSRFSSAGQRMNRICQWNTGVMQLIQFVVGPSGSSPVLVEHPVRAMRLDLNTDARRTEPLDSASLPGLWSELADETKEILSDGYARF